MVQKGLFITLSIYVNGCFGGVQRCTQEYLSVAKAAGWDLQIITYDVEQALTYKILRKISSSKFNHRISNSFVCTLLERIKVDNISWIFLNQVDALPLAPQIKKFFPKVKIILLSHGAQFIDEFLATKDQNCSFIHRSFLAKVILDEMKLRSYVDHVFTLSDQEIVHENWLGSKSTSLIPRFIKPKPLNWDPVEGRVGFVGTLEHQPNYDGLIKVLTILQIGNEFDGCIRIVSSSKKLGEFLEETFSFVKYLGKLNELELQAEASTWGWFIHPLFCWSRGCSTKLADALEWQIPIITTSSGIRGYHWEEGNIIECKTPDEFCSYLVKFKTKVQLEAFKYNVILASNSSPSVQKCSDLFQYYLSQL